MAVHVVSDVLMVARIRVTGACEETERAEKAQRSERRSLGYRSYTVGYLPTIGWLRSGYALLVTTLRETQKEHESRGQHAAPSDHPPMSPQAPWIPKGQCVPKGQWVPKGPWVLKGPRLKGPQRPTLGSHGNPPGDSRALVLTYLFEFFTKIHYFMRISRILKTNFYYDIHE